MDILFTSPHLLEAVAVHLHPHQVHELSFVSKLFAGIFARPTFSFARRNLGMYAVTKDATAWADAKRTKLKFMGPVDYGGLKWNHLGVNYCAALFLHLGYSFEALWYLLGEHGDVSPLRCRKIDDIPEAEYSNFNLVIAALAKAVLVEPDVFDFGKGKEMTVALLARSDRANDIFQKLLSTKRLSKVGITIAVAEAAAIGNLALFNKLLSNRGQAAVDQKLPGFNLTFYRACVAGNAEIVRQLLGFSDVDISNKEYYNQLYGAVACKKVASPLIAALSGGHVECARVLLERKPDLAMHEEILECASRGGAETLRLMLSNPLCNSSCLEQSASRVLPEVAKEGMADTVKVWIETGVVTHKLAFNCILEAIKGRQEKEQSVWELKRGGSIVNSYDPAAYNEVVKLLAGIESFDISMRNNQILRNACEAGCRPNDLVEYLLGRIRRTELPASREEEIRRLKWQMGLRPDQSKPPNNEVLYDLDDILAAASGWGNHVAVKMLLESGLANAGVCNGLALRNAVGGMGWHLMSASESRYTYWSDHMKVVELLLATGPAALPTIWDYRGVYSLWQNRWGAVSLPLNLFTELFEAGVLAPRMLANQFVGHAARTGRMDIVDYLMQSSYPSEPICFFRDSFLAACASGDVRMARKFKGLAKPKLRDLELALNESARRGLVDIVRWLREDEILIAAGVNMWKMISMATTNAKLKLIQGGSRYKLKSN
ncbi:hypothetical protein HK101_002174 [Irineochytrium annulatum]|nr:hypothetical protein HK101_002174 [Irineochytrium annulatum]